jgi:hypothetical protein
MQNHAASLFTKLTPPNINLGSDRFSMFNKERDIPHSAWHCSLTCGFAATTMLTKNGETVHVRVSADEQRK